MKATLFSLLSTFFLPLASPFGVPHSRRRTRTSDAGWRLFAHDDHAPQERNDIERIFCLSDLHTDHADNQKWLQEKVSQSYLCKQDLVVVAGDISHDMKTFEQSLSILLDQTNVLFVPGNHEAWIDKRNQSNVTNSHEKLQAVKTVCQQLGALTHPVVLTGRSPLWILPLDSWYDGSLSFNEELCQDFDTWPWADFQRCVWRDPDFLGQSGPLPTGLVEYILEQNEPLVQPTTETAGIMTVSHFLPNERCLPDWKDLDNPEFQMEWLDHGAGGMSAKFAKVAGTNLLDQQIRGLTSSGRRHIHIFGHSHRPKDFTYKEIRYIHNPLGKPRERKLHQVSPDVDFQLVWDTTNGEVQGDTILRYWEEKGGGLEALQRRFKEVRPRGRYNRDKGSASVQAASNNISKTSS